MQLNAEQVIQLDEFYNNSLFMTQGAVITDLDGTAVHESGGRTIIHQSVEIGLKKIYELGRPIVLNTLRFPLSVIRTFALDWYKISNAPIPVILLNGSQLGYIEKNDSEFIFQQLAAHTLEEEEMMEILGTVKKFLDGGIHELLFFYYPEDWTKGEIIWTPLPEKIPSLQKKYKSASSVISTSFDQLCELMMKQKVCMVFLLNEAPADKLMSYQHTQRNNFFTHKDVDKLTGCGEMASLLKFETVHSIGAGDSQMDVFLNGVGLSVHVGNIGLPFKGLRQTIRLGSFFEFGDLLYRVADRQKAEIN